MQPLFSTQELARELGAADMVILDASYPAVGQQRDLRLDFEQRHIPGARQLDLLALKKATDRASFLEHIGVGSSDRIIVYDDGPLRSATRGWWLLRQCGARNVAVLDGGLSKWTAEGRPVESGPAQPRQVSFAKRSLTDAQVSKSEILTGLPCPLLDARDAARFSGVTSDPRPGIADGHIPGARNLPFASLYAEDGTMKPRVGLRRLFENAGIDPTAPFAASCGSGVTACSLIFAAHLLGNDHVALYEGSWTEWGADPETPKEVGPAVF